MRRLAVLVVTLLASAGSLSAQAKPPREVVPAPQGPQATFKSGVDLVTVSVAVRTENGRVVRDLQRSDFTILDAGQPAKIMDFYAGDSPISLAILLDISGSMAVGGNMDRAREAVTVATMSLRAKDRRSCALHLRLRASAGRWIHQGPRAHPPRQPQRHTLGQDISLRRNRRHRDDGERARQPPSRVARHHRWCRHGKPAHGSGSLGRRELHRRTRCTC